jgi:hypothetical protein
MRYSVFAGGNGCGRACAGGGRCRGPHHRSGSREFGATVDLALPAACAIELIHTYSFITTTCLPWTTTRSGAAADLHVVHGDGIAILAARPAGRSLCAARTRADHHRSDHPVAKAPGIADPQ